MIKPSPKRQEIATVLTAAVRAYRLAHRRAALQKTGLAGRKAAKQLAVLFPEEYSAHGGAKNLVFTGLSADEILEDYLQAEKRGGPEWQRLAALVVYHGEKAERTS